MKKDKSLARLPRRVWRSSARKFVLEERARLHAKTEEFDGDIDRQENPSD